MSLHSAGILCFRYRNEELEVFLVHPGGPFWVNRDTGAWSIPKGLIDENESPLLAARREFQEETGFEVDGEFIELGQLQQPSRKIVHAWAIEKELDAGQLSSNTFEMEWPRRSGVMQAFPEVDKGAWFSMDEARERIYRGQLAFLDRLVTRLK